MRKPDFIVVGAAKSGTTSLFYYLQQHPAIYLPRGKEINYFADDGKGQTRISSFNEYLSFFAGASQHQKVGEVSTSYLFCANAAREIASKIGPDVRIIILLRNPVDMVYSLWGQNVLDGGETLSLEQALEAESARIDDPGFPNTVSGWVYNYAYRARARYAEQVKRYLDVFGRNQVAIYIFEEFFGNLETSLQNVLAFVGVDSGFKPDTGKRYNPQGEIRSKFLHKLYFENSLLAEMIRPILPAPTRRAILMWLYRLNTRPKARESLTPDQRDRLMALFESDIRELEILLDRKLSDVWAGREAT